MRSDLPICGGSKGVPYSMSCLPQPSNPYQKACLKIYSASQLDSNMENHRRNLKEKNMVSLQFYNSLLIIGLLYFGCSTTRVVLLAECYTTYMPCNGSIAECHEEGEMFMESDISRRILEEKRYISPGALRRDQPVCRGGQGGESYSRAGNCLPQQSNPPGRGCEKYYKCRKD
ncbi:hypothetical protein CsatB_025350 [Cannabis sativa]